MQHESRRALAEGVGTFFLVLIGAGAAVVDASTGAVGGNGVALAFAFVVMAMIFALGHLSGAHINPAVTVAFWSAGRFPGRSVASYVAAQCAGATAAALVLRWLLPAGTGAALTLPSLQVPRAFAVEFLLSFALMFVVMAVATDERVANGFGAIAVGATVGVNAIMGGPLTGASMNPARTLGPAVAAGVWGSHWLYWAAPLTGMIAAARVYDFLRPCGAPGVVRKGVATGVGGPLGTAGEDG